MPTMRKATAVALGGITILSGIFTGCATSPAPAEQPAKSVTTHAAERFATIVNAAADRANTSTLQITAGAEGGTKALPGNIRVSQDDGALKAIDIKGYRAPSVPGAMIVVDGNVCFSVIGSGNFTDPAVVAELASCPADDVIRGWAAKAGANAPAGSGPNTAPPGPACSQMAKVTGTFVVAFKQEIGLWDGPMQSLTPRVTIHNGSSLAVRVNFEGAARTSNPLHPERAVNGKWKSWPEIRHIVATGQTMTADIPPANGNIPLVSKGRIEKFDVFAVVNTVAFPKSICKIKLSPRD